MEILKEHLAFLHKFCNTVQGGIVKWYKVIQKRKSVSTVKALIQYITTAILVVYFFSCMHAYMPDTC